MHIVSRYYTLIISKLCTACDYVNLYSFFFSIEAFLLALSLHKIVQERMDTVFHSRVDREIETLTERLHPAR